MNLIGKLVVRFSGVDNEEIFGLGLAYGYHDQPVYLIEEDGENVAWAAQLTRAATPDEQIEYWKRRALVAEGNPHDL